MIFRPWYHFETGCAAYLFGCATMLRKWLSASTLPSLLRMGAIASVRKRGS